jgi:protein-L-isoaspartate(D-aspartate) O-methyltransferase
MTRDFARERDRMVEEQLARRGISDARVLDAMREVPRERFVSAEFAEHAYDDSPLPIEAGQTISQPYIVAAMMVAAEVAPGDRVLEVGAGSGYAAAVASRIAGRVYGVERHEELARLATERMTALGYDNVEIRIGDGSVGLVDEAPFDAILVAAAGRAVPHALKEQLEIGGRLVMPVGGEDNQKLCKITRVDANHYEEDHLGAVAFVPLISEPA